MPTKLADLSAVEIARMVRAREVSALEVTEAALERINLIDPVVHAFVTRCDDEARATARAIDSSIARNESLGPLAGVPASIKDLIFTRGIRTVGGSFEYMEFTPDEDDIAVERLRRAGAVVIGKTNTSEFGYSATGINPVFPATRNPWNLARTSGGSSAGAGAAIACGAGALALGSDGGGSVRIPASFCGAYGLKPSMGRIPLYPGSRDERFPGFSGWESLECYGPITRTVADAALMMSVIAGPDPRDRHSIPCEDVNWIGCADAPARNLRIAYCEDWGYAAVDPEVRQIVSESARVFERELGCVVEAVNPGWKDPAADFAALIVAETDLRAMRSMAAKSANKMSPHLVEWMNRNWTAEQLTNANIARKAIVNSMARVMSRFDLILAPTACVAPFELDIHGPREIEGRAVEPASFLAMTIIANLTGQPAASVPAGFTGDGLPVGMQIIGPHLGDELVIRASAGFERAQPWRDMRPKIALEPPA